MLDPDVASDMPTGVERFAEIGLDPRPVEEVIVDDRGMRCLERHTVLSLCRSVRASPRNRRSSASSASCRSRNFSPASQRLRPAEWSERRV